MRAGGGFGVVLDAEDGVIAVAHSFDSVVVEIEMSNGDGGVWEGVRVDAEAVVLGSDLDLVRAVVQDGMVGAVVAEFQLVGFAAEGKAEDLMTEADAEDGHLADEVSDLSGLVLKRFRIARAIGKKDAGGTEGEDVFGGGIGRDNGYAGTDFDKMAEDVALDAVVVGDDVETLFWRGGAFVGDGDGVDAVGPFITVGGGDARDEILAGHGWSGFGLIDEKSVILWTDSDDAAFGAVIAEMADETAGIDFGDDGDSALGEEVFGFLIGAPVADNG